MIKDTRNIHNIKLEVSKLPYKWWKKGTDFRSLLREQIYNYGTYMDQIKVQSGDNLFTEDIVSKITYLEDIKKYNHKEVSNIQYHHILAINEEIMEYILDRLEGKHAKDELVDILIFIHIYLNTFYEKELYLLNLSMCEEVNRVLAYEFKWITIKDLESIMTLYIYCLHNVSMLDLVTKVTYNKTRSDHTVSKHV